VRSGFRPIPHRLQVANDKGATTALDPSEFSQPAQRLDDGLSGETSELGHVVLPNGKASRGILPLISEAIDHDQQAAAQPGQRVARAELQLPLRRSAQSGGNQPEKLEGCSWLALEEFPKVLDTEHRDINGRHGLS